MPPIKLPAPTIAAALDDETLERQAMALIHLTEQQKAVLEMRMVGKPITEIALTLGLNKRTITQITAHLVVITGSRNATHLIARLARAGKIGKQS